MRAYRSSAVAVRALLAAVLGTAAVVVAAPGPAAAAAPAPCGGVAQIADVVGDGHHDNTDVTAAWLAEPAGQLQVVIRPEQAVWAPVHDDSDAAGFAFLFRVGGAGATRYVRAEAPRLGPARFDYGTWTPGGGFASAGTTGGATIAGTGGTVAIDVPAETGAVAGATLTQTFVLTYDGVADGEPHWVDRAPGGVTPDGDDFGADFVVGSCSLLGGGPGTDPGSVTGTTAVVLRAPARLVGGGAARVRGRVVPARAGVALRLTVLPQGRSARSRTLTTAADGTFETTLAITRATRLRATAEGIASQTLAIGVRSTVRIVAIGRLRDGSSLIRGRVRPQLPGRVLLLRANAVTPTATTTARGGRFRLRVAHPRHGAYQAVFIPFGGLAERSTSKPGVIR